MTDENDLNYMAMQALLQPISQGLTAMAMRPQKTWQSTNTVQETTPYALQDLLTARNTIGAPTQKVADALKARENPWYATLKALGQIKTTAEPGAWLEAGVQGLSAGGTALDDIKADNAQKLYELQMNDLAQRLAYDNAMGNRQTQRQKQSMGYTEMPYSGGKGGATQETVEPESYDLSKPEMPEKPIEWSDIDIQGQKTDPATGLPTVTGLIAKYTGLAVEPEGRFSKNANQNAYTKTFTVPAITKVAKAAGGSRGIDTMPEVNIKGGPELSSTNMNATEFANAVKDQAWDIADQIIKANPNATISRKELADALINNFNHRIRKEYRVVKGFDNETQSTKSQETNGITSKNKYDYSKYGF